MKILVTGGSGFIGSRVVQQLASRPGMATVVLVRGTSDLGRLRACGVMDATPGVSLVAADLCDAAAVDALLRRLRPDVLIHLAMVYHTLGSAGRAAVEAVNLHGTMRLFAGFRAAGGRRFVFAGTCFEYGHPDAEQVEETAPCRPIYEYAVAKAKATDAILKQAEAASTEALVLRLFAPYGPLEDSRRIVPQLLAAGRAGRRLELTPGEQVRDYVYVEDAARAFVTAALQPVLPRSRAIYNVCTGIGHSLKQLAAEVEVVLGRRLDLAWGKLPYRPNEMMRLVGSNRRIAAELGWQPICTLREGLRRTAEAGETAGNRDTRQVA